MNSDFKTAIIIPTFNEKKNIGILIPKLFDCLKKEKINAIVLVVDDNSPDKTGKVVKEMSNKYDVELFLRKEKKGIGSAYIDGFKYILKNTKVQNIITMDGDLSHDIKLIPLFLKEIKTNDMVIGSRYIKGGNFKNWPKYRKLVSCVANKYASVILGINTHDVSSGYRCYRRKLIESINLEGIREKGYSFFEEILFACIKEGAKIKEVPLVFTDRKYGKTKLGVSEITNYLIAMFRIRRKYYYYGKRKTII
ncbi:MAG: polyprenol monophosphomannose synthase [Candidatus Aenigmarchaeota archaeon]|nr:polyprenol monophosphomannose synthase [Candidatus Aenigmarchaeota archaeon]